MSFLQNLLQRITSRKFLLTVASAYVMYNTAMTDSYMSPEEMMAVMAPIMAFLGFEGWADARRAR